MYFVYVIQSSRTGRYYIGYTSDLGKRITAHNNNKTASLRNQGPFILVHSEGFTSREEAFKRERQIKRYKGGNAFIKLINTNSRRVGRAG